jgi:trk system potassium uptake protein
MKQFAIIGLGAFGRHILEELIRLDFEVLIVDRDPAVIDQFKDRVAAAFAADAADEQTLRRILPEATDAVIIDFENSLETSILATSHCRKMGIRTIVAKAFSEEHADILEIVGASRVVLPDKEAARRLTPQLLSSSLLNYLPVSPDLVIAEVGIPDQLVGMTSIEASFRTKFNLNVIAIKTWPREEYEFFSPDHRFGPDDVALVAGHEDRIVAFAGGRLRREHSKGVREIFRHFFPGLKKK